LFHIGRIKYFKLFDLDGAMNAFQQMNRMPISLQKADATGNIGDVQVQKTI